MPEPENLAKAKLVEIEWVDDEAVPSSGGKTIDVQFNPETLTVAYANQKAGGDQRGGSAMQYVGQGTTKLSLELWFDVTGELPTDKESVKDVRELTEEIVFFITPNEETDGNQAKWKAPGLRFSWGSFLFDGVVDSINEKLELFSEDGRPLRAQISLSLSSQAIQFQLEKKDSGNGAGGGATPGTSPLTAAPEDTPLQSMTGSSGGDWQDTATENGIENPRQIPPGTLINLRKSGSG